MTNKKFTIAPVTVLHGHISPETAYVVEDYPYGGELRCQIRFWLYTADKGQHRGKTRCVYQTTDPMREGVHWKQPRSSAWADWMVLYVEPTEQGREGERFVRHLATGRWVDAAFADRVRLCGAYAQLSQASRTRLDRLIEQSRQTLPEAWGHYEQFKHDIGRHYASSGELPARVPTGELLGRLIAEDHYQVICASVLGQGHPAH